MATKTKTGKATIDGIAGVWDVILYPVAQSVNLSHKFDLRVTKDNQGQDAAWMATNEMVEGDWRMKLMGDTNAHAAAGGVFLAPLTKITFSGGDLSVMNTSWQYTGGSTIDLKSDDVADLGIPVRRYIDATQNTLFGSTPS